jgi:hypothetical protein
LAAIYSRDKNILKMMLPKQMAPHLVGKTAQADASATNQKPKTAPMNTLERQVHVTRIPADLCGNPRFVTHFLDWLAPSEIERGASDLSALYDRALKRARKVGGRKYHNRSFGGGVVVQAYCRFDVEDSIARALTAALQLSNSGMFLQTEITGYTHVVWMLDGRILSTHSNPASAAERALELAANQQN